MNKHVTKCFRAWRWISVAMWLRPSTPSSSFSPTSSSPFSGALMENVFSKASGSDSLIEIKRLFKIFPSMLVFLLQGQDVGCQVGNVCFGSPIILWDLCKWFFPSEKNPWVYRYSIIFRGVTRHRQQCRDALVAKTFLGGTENPFLTNDWLQHLHFFNNINNNQVTQTTCQVVLGSSVEIPWRQKSFSSIFHFRPRWNWKLQKQTIF